MAEMWPTTLPQSPLSGTLTQQGQDNLVRGPADVGEGVRRRRASAVSHALNFSMIMTGEQVRILDLFYDSNLGGGVYRFWFTDPISGDAKEFSFSERYQVQHDQSDIYRVSISLIRKAE